MKNHSQQDNPGICLPEWYQPSSRDVILGRGKKIARHIGNTRLRGFVEEALTSYANADSKTEKSSIIISVMDRIRNSSNEEKSAIFVKYHKSTSRWYVAKESTARTAVAQAFRDALSFEYKSSKEAKRLKRIKWLVSSNGREQEHRQHQQQRHRHHHHQQQKQVKHEDYSAREVPGADISEAGNCLAESEKYLWAKMTSPSPPSDIPPASVSMSTATGQLHDPLSEFLLNFPMILEGEDEEEDKCNNSSSSCDGDKLDRLWANLLMDQKYRTGGMWDIISDDPLEPKPIAEEEEKDNFIVTNKDDWSMN